MFRFFVACGSVLASLPAQLFTTDAGVISPELPQWKQRFEWLPRARSDEWRTETLLSYSPDRLMQIDLAVPLVSRRVEAMPGSLRG
ncbi:MAG: hypothetical protein ABIP94_06010, partial [Planctomycetota bacterium]